MTTDKRVTVLHTIETSGAGGAESVLHAIATGVDRTRFRSIALLLYDNDLKRQLEAQGVRVYVVSWKGWYDPSLVLGMLRIVREEGVDIIHAHLPYMNFYAALIGALTRTATVVCYHGPIEFSHAATIGNRIKNAFVRRARGPVVVVSDRMKEFLVGRGIPRDRIVRIFNGVSPARYRGTARGAIRASEGLSPDAQIVGMVANVRRSKGYEYFVRAARIVLERYPDTVFVAAGDIDPGLGAPILDLVRELRLEDRVRFIGFRSDVPAVLADLDVFVLASTSEGFPVVVLEAMASRRAIVGTICGGVEEMLEDGESGILVPVGDAERLADGIMRLLGDPGLAARLGERAEADVERRFSLAGMLAQYEALYQRCLSRG